jgi:hypothetical protein
MEENKEGTECVVCDTAIEPDDVIFTTDGDAKPVCSDCVRICERCSNTGTSDDDYCEIDGRDMWCDECVRNYASHCAYCEEYTSQGVSYIQDRGDYWCNFCTEDNATYCDDCDNYYQDGCDNCYQEPETIHDYSYRPDLIFHTTNNEERLYFGMEIELECRDGRYEPAEYAGNRLEQYDLAYLKSDGSLNDGFEIVTHPMTHDFFKNEATEFWDTLATLRDRYKVMTWGASTTGIHIHISRTGFNGGAHMHRFLNLVYSNEGLFSQIAGRSSSRWAKFDDVMEAVSYRDEFGNRSYKTYRGFSKKINDGRNTDRYSAVNTQNRDTLELRIFKSTTKPERIKAYMDLAHASVEYTRTQTLQQVKDGALSRDAFIAYVRENLSLYEHLNGLFDQLDISIVRLAEQNVSE